MRALNRLVALVLVVAVINPPLAAAAAAQSPQALAAKHGTGLIARYAVPLAAALGKTVAQAEAYLLAQFEAEAVSRAIVAFNNGLAAGVQQITRENFLRLFRNSGPFLTVLEEQMVILAADNAFLQGVYNSVRTGFTTVAVQAGGQKASESGIVRLLRAGTLVQGLVFLLNAILLAQAASGGFEKGREVGNDLMKERDIAVALELRASELQERSALTQLLLTSVKAGRVKLLDGVQLDDALNTLARNLEEGRRPFEGIFEPRKPPDVSGPWKGEIHLKYVEGPSRIDKEFKPPAIAVSPANFEIVQDGWMVTLRWQASRISGQLYPDGEVLLHRTLEGTVSEGKLRLFGPKDGSFLSGKLEIEFRQPTPQGGALVRGGILERAR